MSMSKPMTRERMEQLNPDCVIRGTYGGPLDWELCIGLYNDLQQAKTSLAHPLSHDGSVLYAQLFREILPNTPMADEIAQLGTMAHDNEVERLLANLAQKTRAPD